MLGLFLAMSVAALASTSQAAANENTLCASLLHHKFEDGTTINSATLIPQGSNFTGHSIETSYNTLQTNLPSLCRVSFTVLTSSISSAVAEIWLPTPSTWTGRFLAVGNGGFAGGINYPDIIWGARKGFATMSTNTGHNLTQSDGSWMLEQPEKTIDFGHRALHVATRAAKEIVGLYYGERAEWSYYAGCSTGGRQGLSASQRYPDDYDGILAGSAIASQTNTSAWQDWVALPQFPNNKSSYIPASLWPTIHAAVLSQCDHLDGLSDGILMDPLSCHFDPSPLLCAANTTNTTSCLTSPQLENLAHLYTPWIEVNDHPGLSPGGELSFSYLLNGAAPQFGPSFYRYAVFNDSTWDWSTMNASDVAFANAMNPGGMNAYSMDYSGFKGKLVQYHGWADPLIPSLTAVKFSEALQGDVDNFYRLFMVPGMGHCSGGAGAWVLDSASQGGVVPPRGDSMLWSLVAWVERGESVEEVIGTKYVNDTAGLGVEFRRPVCRWPGVAEYAGGDSSLAENWSCPK